MTKFPFRILVIVLLVNVAHGSSGKVLHTFKYPPGGTLAEGRMISDAAGNLYGTTAAGGTNNLGVVFELSNRGGGRATETVLHTFTGPDGAKPTGGVVMDSAGNLFGTTQFGGSPNCQGGGCGVIFELTHSQNGWSESILYQFSQSSSQPSGELIFDANGNLYGTAGGGKLGGGVVFELSPANGKWNYTLIYEFDWESQAVGPLAPLTFDEAGNLYGTTGFVRNDNGGDDGTVFKLTPGPAGWNLTVLHVFYSDLPEPNAGLVLDRQGNLYGTTQGGGTENQGTIFRITRGTWAVRILYSFRGTNGSQPLKGLVADSSGNLYGTTWKGGDPCDVNSYGCGVVFRLSHNSGRWSGGVLHKFSGGNDGSNPGAALTVDGAGNIYGTTIGPSQNGVGTAFRLTQTPDGGVKETVIHYFADTDGQSPYGSMTVGPSGTLYATTQYGGDRNSGAVVELTKTPSGSWKESVIFSFEGGLGGYVPAGSLLLDPNGNLFGTTFYGGHNDYYCGGSCGVVFELTPSPDGWKESVLYTFLGGSDGRSGGGLVEDVEGNLYGTTGGGGSYNSGTVYQLSLGANGWTKTIIYSFRGGNGDGAGPFAGLTQDAAGNLYGTTAGGGNSQCSGGCGTVFQLTKATGWTESLLHYFKPNGIDGTFPSGSLTFDSAGNLYGTTANGGSAGHGTVFQLVPNNGDWSEHVLYSFSGPDGNRPLAGVTLDSAGNVYGTTIVGGSGVCNFGDPGCGVFFELSPNGDGTWRESFLYSFTGGKDGGEPLGGLALDSLGHLYGTTEVGGVGIGVVFEFTP